MSYDLTKLAKLKALQQLANEVKTNYAKKSELPTKVSDLTNDSNFQTQTQVESAISAAVAGSLIPGGSVLFANLPALSATNKNHIYNVEDAFTTTADFLEGAGKSYPAGTNVAIIDIGTESTPAYKYDTYTGTFDFSGFATKVAGGTSGNFPALDAEGNLTDSGYSADDFAGDISGKADKVANATADHFASLDANGNLQDSGKSASDFNKVLVPTEGAGTVTVDGTTKAIVYIATDAEVTEMLNDVFNPSSGS